MREWPEYMREMEHSSEGIQSHLDGFRRDVDSIIVDKEAQGDLASVQNLEKAKEALDAGRVTPENFKETLKDVGHEFDERLMHKAGVEPVFYPITPEDIKELDLVAKSKEKTEVDWTAPIPDISKRKDKDNESKVA